MAYAGGRAILIVSLVLCAVNPPYVNAEQATQINAPQLLIPNPDIPVLASNPGEVTLRWTAPGDDGNIGTANHYIVRYSSNPITESNWGSAITIPNPPAPLPAGSAQSFTFSGLPMGTAYYFAIKTFDEAGNSSALSNVIRKFTGGIQTPALAGESVDTTRALAVLDADTVAAPVRLKYQFALDSIRSFPNPRIAADSLVDSLASVTYSSLGHGHRYFWRCRAMAFDNSDSSLWSYADSFYMPQAISDTPRVVVSSPNGGERWNIGSSHPITWSATDSGGVTSYAIDYSTNAGTNWVAVVPQTNGNPLAFNWTVPATPSVTCLVRVRAWDPSGNVGNDVSNAVFAIVRSPYAVARLRLRKNRKPKTSKTRNSPIRIGTTIATTVMIADTTSSPTLTKAFPNPPVVAVTTGRAVAFTAWTLNARINPRMTATTGCKLITLVLAANKIAPAVGRMKV